MDDHEEGSADPQQWQRQVAQGWSRKTLNEPDQECAKESDAALLGEKVESGAMLLGCEYGGCGIGRDEADPHESGCGEQQLLPYATAVRINGTVGWRWRLLG